MIVLKKYFVIFFSFLCLLLFSKNNNTPPVNIKFEYESKLSVGFVDKDDDINKTDIFLAKNRPKKTEELLLFFLINNKYKQFILGTYLKSNFDIRFDYRNMDRILFLEKISGYSETGMKLGYKFKNKAIKNSKIVFSTPIYFSYDNTTDFFKKTIVPGSFYIGTNFGVEFDLNIKKAKAKFHFNNNIIIAQNTILEYMDEKDLGFYFEEHNKVEFEIKPFNFIDKRIDLWVNINNEFSISYNTIEIALKNKLSLGLEWKGFKYLYLGWNYFVYKTSLLIPKDDIYDAHDQFQSISMEIMAKARYQMFSFLFEYRPIFFVLDKILINKDSIKPHIFIFAIELKL